VKALTKLQVPLKHGFTETWSICFPLVPDYKLFPTLRTTSIISTIQDRKASDRQTRAGSASDTTRGSPVVFAAREVPDDLSQSCQPCQPRATQLETALHQCGVYSGMTKNYLSTFVPWDFFQFTFLDVSKYIWNVWGPVMNTSKYNFQLFENQSFRNFSCH